MVSQWLRFLGIVGLVAGVCPAFGQVAPESTVTAALGSLSARAGTVFAGSVVAIRPLGGVVEIQFQVEQTLKGQTSGSVVLREWAGLWAAGQRRYWVGERAVIFLHDAGKSGLSSPVDGMEGVLPLSQIDALSAPSVDVGRIRAAVLRAAGAPMVDSPQTMSLAQVTSVVQGDLAPIAPVHVPVHGAPVIAQPLPTEGLEGSRKSSSIQQTQTVLRATDGTL